MEEQEKTEVKNKKEKKPIDPKKLIKHRILFVLFYIVILICITAGMIIKQNKSNETIEEKEKAVDEIQVNEKQRVKHNGLIDYDKDTYNMNDLKIMKKEEIYKDEKLFYYQIDGLLNKEIQKSINLDLKKDYEKLIDYFINNYIDNYETEEYDFYHGSYFSSSFANTLSIYYYGYLYDPEYNGNWRDTITYYACENYDLTTGKKLTLNDLFADDTRGSKIFDSHFYNELVSTYTDVEMDEDTWEMSVVDYRDIEDEIFELCYRFDKKDIDVPFIFDTQKVYLVDINTQIFFEDVLDYVAIYNRYKTGNSIFNGQYKKVHDLPVLTLRHDTDYQVLEMGENYYIDITLVDVYFPFQRQENYNTIQSSVIERIKDDVEKYKEEANNSSKFLVINGYYSISAHGNTNWETYDFVGDETYEVSVCINKHETTKSMFNSKVYPAIQLVERTAQRVESGEDYLWNNQFMGYIGWKAEWEDFNYDYEYYDLYIDRVGNISETPIWGVND